MQLVHVYVSFPGTTREAFEFYETVFGTKITMIQTFGDTSFMPNVPDAAKSKIVHAQLRSPSPCTSWQATLSMALVRPSLSATTFTSRSSPMTRPKPIACSLRSASGVGLRCPWPMLPGVRTSACVPIDSGYNGW